MLTASDIEKFVRDNSGFPLDYTFLCGEEFFDMVAKYINDGNMTLPILKRCMTTESRIFDNKPFDRSSTKYLVITPRKRLVMLKKAHMVIAARKSKDPILLLEDRLRRLERRVERLQEEIHNS